MAWVMRPPEIIKSGTIFNVIYSVTAQDSFYDWAIQNHIFTHRLIYNYLRWIYLYNLLGSQLGLSSAEMSVCNSSILNAEAARKFCEHQECPANWKDADGENCCIHHANIHSCPMAYMVSDDVTCCVESSDNS